MKDSFDEISALVDAIQEKYPKMDYSDVIETAKLITWNQFFIEVAGLFEEGVVH